MRHPLLVPDLRELIHDGEIAGLRDFFADHHPGRVAEMIEDLETDDGDALFRILPPRNRAEVLSYLDNDRQVRLVEAMPPKEAAELLHVMSHDERADLVNRLDEDVRRPGPAATWPRPSARTSAGWPATSPAPPARS